MWAFGLKCPQHRSQRRCMSSVVLLVLLVLPLLLVLLCWRNV